MFALFVYNALSFIDEDFYGHLQAGQNTLDINTTDRRFRVESGLYVALLVKDISGIDARVSDDTVVHQLFNNSYAVMFNKDGYFIIKSDKPTSIEAIAFQAFKYPKCDSIVTLIGDGTFYSSCKASDADFNLGTGKSECMYFAFEKSKGIAETQVNGRLKGKYYDVKGITIKNTASISEPFVIHVDNPNTYCNTDIAGANVTGNNEIISVKITPNGNYTYINIGKPNATNWTLIIIIVAVIIGAGLIVTLVVVGICIYHCVAGRKKPTIPNQEQLELGMIEVPPKEYNPYDNKNPLAAAQDKVL